MNPNFINWSNLLNFGTTEGAVFLAIVLGLVTIIINKVLTKLIQEKPNWAMGRLKRRVDETMVRYLVHMKTLLLLLLAVLVYISLIPQLRTLVATLIAGAGITAIVIGFAAKPTLANFVSGIAIAFYRPFRIGDKLMINDQYCTVEDITLRHTIVMTWQNKRLVIPNEQIDQMTITNMTIIDPRILCTVEMGVSYDTDIDLAKKVILEEAMTCPHRLKDAQEPWVRVIEWADFSIVLRLYVWTHDMDGSWAARFWLLESIKKRFDRQGIEIPFPYRTVVYKNDLPPAPRLADAATDHEAPPAKPEAKES